jgi:hypothetical protein
MDTNKLVLDEFGKIIVNNVVDRIYRGISKAINVGFKNPTMQHYNDIFNKLNTEEKSLLIDFIYENTNSTIFDILNIFEENRDFKLIYEKDGKQINLVEISEMLKAELIIENGWIDRFSEEIK